MSYHPVAVSLTAHHKQQLAHAHQHGQAIKIRLGHHQLHGSDLLHLTKTQIKHLQKAKNEGKGADVSMSGTQIKKIGGKMGHKMIKVTSGSKTVKKRRTKKDEGKGMFLPGTGLARASKMMERYKPKAVVGGSVMSFDIGSGLFLPGSGAQVQNVSRGFKDAPNLVRNPILSMRMPPPRIGAVSRIGTALTSGQGLDDIHGTQLGRRGQGLGRRMPRKKKM